MTEENVTNQTHGFDGFDTPSALNPAPQATQPKGSADNPEVDNQDTSAGVAVAEGERSARTDENFPDNTEDEPEDALKDEPYEPEHESTEGGRRKRTAGGRRKRSPFVQSVLDQIPIEAEIGKDVQLRQSSKKFSGLCPFHNDTHPSFEVYPQTKSWFCYGCQKGGSLIDYVMYRDSLTPAESIRRLCETYNISQPSWMEQGVECFIIFLCDHLSQGYLTTL